MTANACYTSGGTPAAPVSIHGTTITCPGGDVANPYWFAAVQPLVNTSQPFCDRTTSSRARRRSPVLTVRTTRRTLRRWCSTTSMISSRSRRRSSSKAANGTVIRSPRSESIRRRADVRPLPAIPDSGTISTSCASVVNIPNPYTGIFDSLNAFAQPDEFMMNLQLSYDVSPQDSARRHAREHRELLLRRQRGAVDLQRREHLPIRNADDRRLLTRSRRTRRPARLQTRRGIAGRSSSRPRSIRTARTSGRS